MNDLCKKQSAIDIVKFECGKWTGLAKTIEKRIKDLPSEQPVQPERKKGKIEMRSTGYYGYAACDQCGIGVHPDDKFCRDCGVKFER